MKQIGDKVWIAGLVHTTYTIKCPHCSGQRYIKALVPESEPIDLACAGCGGHQYDSYPTGRVERWRYEAKAEEATITGIDANSERVEYKFQNRYGCEVFETQSAAIAFAETLREKQEAGDRQKFEWAKESAKRTWAWNLYYHRRGVADAKRDMAYHESKLRFIKEQGNDKKAKAEEGKR